VKFKLSDQQAAKLGYAIANMIVSFLGCIDIPADPETIPDPFPAPVPPEGAASSPAVPAPAAPEGAASSSSPAATEGASPEGASPEVTTDPEGAASSPSVPVPPVDAAAPVAYCKCGRPAAECGLATPEECAALIATREAAQKVWDAAR